MLLSVTRKKNAPTMFTRISIEYRKLNTKVDMLTTKKKGKRKKRYLQILVYLIKSF